MQNGPCLYCKKTEGDFTSVEHIVPQCLGNDELILPKGVVCDSCNNGVLANLDSFLADFLALHRVYFRIPTKAGKIPIARFANMTISPTDTGIYVDLDHRRFIKEGRPKADGSIEFSLKIRGPRMTRTRCQKLARAFYKIALGVIYLDVDDHKLDPRSERFNEVREIIQGEKDFSGYIIILGEKPDNKSNMQYQCFNLPDGTELILFHLNFFGMKFMFDFEQRKVFDAEQFRQHGFTVLEW